MEEEKITWLDPKTIVNTEEFSIIENVATCPICLGILLEPIQCSVCDNCFCERCYEKYKEMKNTNDCVFKCKNITTRKSHLMKKVLANIKFKCENGCGQDIRYSDLKDHYLKGCPKLDYKQKLLNLLKKKDEFSDKIKELNTTLANIEENEKQKNDPRVFDERVRQHPNYNKNRGRAGGLGLFGSRNIFV